MVRRGIATAVVSVAAVALAPALVAPGAAAVTALVMGGTDQPDPEQLGDYLPHVHTEFLAPFTSCAVGDCDVDGVVYPAQFWPFPQWGGTDALTYDRSVSDGVLSLETALRNAHAADPEERVVLFGSSQSATVVTFVKRRLATHPTDMPTDVQIVMIGNPNRPNGGLLARFAGLTIPVLEFTGSGGTPTEAGIPTTDIAFQYDIAADFPKYPLNLFALLNSVIGIDIHGDYLLGHNGYTEAELLAAMQDPNNQQVYGDTTYITIPTRQLPLVQPLRQLGIDHGATAITEPLVALIEPTLRVLVELGYDRDTEYGRPSGFGLFPRIDPVQLTTDLAGAFDTGIKNARATISTPPEPLEPDAPAEQAEASSAVDRHRNDGADDELDNPHHRTRNDRAKADAKDNDDLLDEDTPAADAEAEATAPTDSGDDDNGHTDEPAQGSPTEASAPTADEHGIG
ncbi:hypothetical protein BVC93_17610 [Mycobacterium sp. MS1601]|uniref:PE-PPE domain-containing protein n=1 Tax=Mycobacterium sp. MS1601 TaxID=1936029 RepID=UPI00097957F8|nr:PE-PPE domain-containing protein [Mycobacterium sp. MS1601]AQA03946.1 hypothetical protein BVC93_17610 [Mycobacterium sp. MS1601]